MTSAEAERGPGLFRRLLRLARRLVVLALVLSVAAVAAAIVLEAKLRRSDVFGDYPGRPESAGGVNWLLVGSDSRVGLSDRRQEQLATGGDVGPPRSDTVLLVHQPGSGQTVVVSLPRDSFVPIPGEPSRDKLNTAYARGGARLLAQTVELATGLRLDHYAEIGFGGLADVVDAVGGVDMCLDEPLSDPLAGVDLPKGCQHLDGAKALGLSRSRATPRADLDRMLHQRVLMAALMAKLDSGWTLANPLRASALWRALVDDVSFDDSAHVWQLASLAKALGGPVEATVVPIGGFEDTDVGNVVVWDKDKAKALFQSMT
ncbi:MAG: LCP family protein [Segniliparus sp.]|uniref:LCP family protein n=1 Tax=Segniliparus sp. TaxID=2804064 RepID=UPI003F2E63FC